MTEHTNITNTPLVYKGEIIRDKGEMLSLTDMWKAAGSPAGRAPADWRALGSTIEFAGHVSEILNAGKSGNDLFVVTRGGRASGTMAHWQMGLAYAKYLAPEFHMWCNQVVRERMEAKPAPSVPMVMDDEMRKIFGGIVKTVVHAQLTDVMPQLVAGYIAEHNLSIADGVTAGEVCDLSRVSAKYPRGISARVSRQMVRFCAVRNIDVPVTRMGRVRAMVFPTYAAREWLDLEGRGLIKRWVNEKAGQGSLRLVKPVREPEVLTALRNHLNGAH